MATMGTKKALATKTGGRVFKSVKTNNPFWYLEHTDDLEMVTSDDNNMALGIEKILAFAPSDKQAEYGTICNVKIITIVGEIGGLNVKEAKDGSGAISVFTSSRAYQKEGKEEKTYYNDVTLNKAVKAQILSFIETCLVEE